MVTSVAVVERWTKCGARVVFVFIKWVVFDAVVDNSLNEELIRDIVWEIFNLKNLKYILFYFYLFLSSP